jgi:hypothetical protein
MRLGSHSGSPRRTGTMRPAATVCSRYGDNQPELLPPQPHPRPAPALRHHSLSLLSLSASHSRAAGSRGSRSRRALPVLSGAGAALGAGIWGARDRQGSRLVAHSVTRFLNLTPGLPDLGRQPLKPRQGQIGIEPSRVAAHRAVDAEAPVLRRVAHAVAAAARGARPFARCHGVTLLSLTPDSEPGPRRDWFKTAAWIYNRSYQGA